ncbi:Exocyst complex component EXO70A1 [Mucuna pruriens]|uniref:Exocyst subunit Exo70 family protein n=1 Tax=Mucuna pruriens TaxID=157652 RepID=A0A371GLQ0_MUCPR|nr:Exocyst complex component EXO70A1 [Mucuna pruriens]
MMGIAAAGGDLLSEKAALMRESLQKSQTIADNVVTILGSFDHRLSALETAMRPTQIRTHSIRKAHENIDKTLKAAEVILVHFDQYRQAEAKILKGPHEDLENYLEAIDKLRSNIQFFGSKKGFKSSDGIVGHANNLLAKAISKLEDEFKQLLSSYSKPVEPECLFDCLPNSMRPASGSPGHEGDPGGKNPSNHHSEHHNNNADAVVYTPPALIPPRFLPLLHDLAQQMVEAGGQQQLLKIYRDARSNVLEESLQKLGVEKLNKDDVQKLQWEILEAKIGNWIHFMRIAVKLLFAGERKVCDQIFEGFDSLSEQCFAEVTTNSVSMLLSFGEAIAKSKRSPEKLFVLLDMYEIMQELHSEVWLLTCKIMNLAAISLVQGILQWWYNLVKYYLPYNLQIEALFKGKACSGIREAATSLTKRLAQTAQETFGDFEEAVEKDATKTAVTDGTVHPLTSYVINYVNYQSTLKQLFQEFESGDDSSQLASVTVRIMQALQTNLDGKSKQYKDLALTHLFLMNNIHYIVRSVRRHDLLGDDWVQRHRRIVQQHANQYKRNAWAKILQCLSIQGLTSSGGGSGTGGGDSGTGSSSGASRAIVKDRFKTFNTMFEELHQKQSQWAVPDTELRESLRLAVAEVLLPAYRSFVKRFGPLVESGKNPQKYIKYTPEDLDRMLGEFFEGKNISETRRSLEAQCM